MQAGLDELEDQFLFDAPRPEKKSDQSRNRGGRQPENLWVLESHFIKATFAKRSGSGSFPATAPPVRQWRHGRTTHHNSDISLLQLPLSPVGRFPRKSGAACRRCRLG